MYLAGPYDRIHRTIETIELLVDGMFLQMLHPPSIHRDALIQKWKALADPLSLVHGIIATPCSQDLYCHLQLPTRKSARLNLAPTLVVEQRLSSRKPFQRAAQTPLANLGEACPVPQQTSARQLRVGIFVSNSWKRSYGVITTYLCLVGTLPQAQSGPSEGHHESDRMVAFQSTDIGSHC